MTILAALLAVTAVVAWCLTLPVLAAGHDVRVGARGNGTPSGVRQRPRPTPPEPTP